MFAIWDETGQEQGLSLPQLQQRLHNYQGDVMVRYLNRLGLSTTLFLTVREGRAYQRFKAGTPPLDWAWLDQAIGHVPLLDGRLPQSHHALR
ncbi:MULTISPECIES: hypothetical protein [Aeromonas]|jgi:hypothetical protein|uniref:hypothetical protein n=1 Tax=Aeromonas TaxID=642 RepID=UPI000FBFE23C|nr:MULTISPECIES: hypothetical protein [Aeromonas]MBV7415940.1 hypothetical protein [Aeromonas sp. sif2433]UNP89213.1 hypothetical protein MNZ22_01625 [Aeromonas encheleia]